VFGSPKRCCHRRCYSRSLIDADWIRALARQKGAWANMPPKRNRTRSASARICITRNLIERFFNKIKQCRRVATRHDKLAAFIKFASIRIWPRPSSLALACRFHKSLRHVSAPPFECDLTFAQKFVALIDCCDS
jgi:transposase